ncbi:MAG: TetR/AcrR family transcriptional regulator [Actinobacteria bacterium]|nr:TetR/AcrR family transcriptional regulator [Actinomycetota bacterium]
MSSQTSNLEPTTRHPLTRERIIAAAVDYADSHGVDDLSMRKLGAELGVEAMSLYNHVENKDDIYDGMIDHVFESIPIPDRSLPWQGQVRLIGEAAMDAFGRHPWVVLLLMQRGNFGPGALAFMDNALGVLRDAGFGDEDIHHAWQMLASHTMGYAFQQGANPEGRTKEYADLESRLSQVAGRFPNVARIGSYLAECRWDQEYLFGLEIIIDGLESRLPPTT